MKKAVAIALILALALTLTACGSSFGLTENTEKRMTITAQRAEKDATFIVGALEVEEGEKIVITSDLTKGSVRVEIIGTVGEQSADVLPDMDGEPIITANLERTDAAAGTVPAGSYLLKAVCLKRATGTVRIEVLPAD